MKDQEKKRKKKQKKKKRCTDPSGSSSCRESENLRFPTRAVKLRALVRLCRSNQHYERPDRGSSSAIDGLDFQAIDFVFFFFFSFIFHCFYSGFVIPTLLVVIFLLPIKLQVDYRTTSYPHIFGSLVSSRPSRHLGIVLSPFLLMLYVVYLAQSAQPALGL